MSIKKRPIKGISYWIIDRSFRSSEGVVERYRRVSQVQTRAAAEKEERDIIAYWERHGTILPLMKPELRPSKEPKPKPKPASAVPTWDDAVKHYRAVVAPTLKPSRRAGYEAILEGPHMTRWKGVPLKAITRHEIAKWDASLMRPGSGSTRRNHHVVLRSILKSVGPSEDGELGLLLAELPKLPKLPRVGRVAVEAPEDADVKAILNEVDDEERHPVRSAQRRSARLAFALAICAGLRAGEVRALRVRDVKGGKIVVRLARTGGVEAAPKSGHQREVPYEQAGLLAPMLKQACDGKAPEDYVCTKIDGEPWGDTGLRQALDRACKRLGITGTRYHNHDSGRGHGRIRRHGRRE